MTDAQKAGLMGIAGILGLAGLGWLLDGDGVARNPRARRYEKPRDLEAFQAYRGFSITRGLDGLYYISKDGHPYGGGRQSLAAAKTDVDTVA